MGRVLLLLISLMSFSCIAAQEPADSVEYLQDELDAANAELAAKDIEIERLNRENNWSKIWSSGRSCIRIDETYRIF